MNRDNQPPRIRGEVVVVCLGTERAHLGIVLLCLSIDIQFDGCDFLAASVELPNSKVMLKDDGATVGANRRKAYVTALE